MDEGSGLSVGDRYSIIVMIFVVGGSLNFLIWCGRQWSGVDKVLMTLLPGAACRMLLPCHFALWRVRGV